VNGPRDEALVVTIIQMARNLGLGTVAEGIEDEPTLERLKALGCDMGQGFLWAKAIAPEAFEAFYFGHGQA
jgi:EAL domain-containing protein (putative c-di-GMP-specific phosphodiesterase class I)